MSTVESLVCLMESCPPISLLKLAPPSVFGGHRESKGTMPPTEVQPVKSCHQRIKGPHGNQDTTNEDKAEMLCHSVSTHPATCSMMFFASQQLHPHSALQQLHAGVISKEDIVQDDDSDEGKNTPESSPAPSMDEHTPPMVTWIVKLRNK
ncbi:hypothetical protein EDC04DRAFT_2609073 [Pisolithus marmoratus]|nr:hypothetical protein EDC04DRAFT_2609073 [Pisolithus marmoratus]